VALHAAHVDRDGQRATTTDAQYVTEPLARRGLAGDAVVDALAGGAEVLEKGIGNSNALFGESAG
jgi:hypothetical protein